MLFIYLAFVCRNKFDRSFLYLEINIQKIKWLLCSSYNLNKNNIHAHLENLERSLSLYSWSYENHITICDFNVVLENTSWKHLRKNVSATILIWQNLIKEFKCFKNPENLSYIDLILNNWPQNFENYCAFKTGLSDFHKMSLTEKVFSEIIKLE